MATLQIKSKLGEILYALFAIALMDIPKATIVLGHPMGKEAKGYFLKYVYVELLRKNGYNTFKFDINGFGENFKLFFFAQPFVLWEIF